MKKEKDYFIPKLLFCLFTSFLLTFLVNMHWLTFLSEKTLQTGFFRFIVPFIWGGFLLGYIWAIMRHFKGDDWTNDGDNVLKGKVKHGSQNVFTWANAIRVYVFVLFAAVFIESAFLR